MRKAISLAHVTLAWIVLASVITEFFFAGLGVFRGASFEIHQVTGYLIGAASLLLLVLALVGWLGKKRIGLSALLIALMFIQMWLVHSSPLIGALHPLNAVIILYVVMRLARLNITLSQRG